MENKMGNSDNIIKTEDILKMNITEFLKNVPEELRKRIIRALNNAGVKYVSQLVKPEIMPIPEIKGIGLVSLEIIFKLLKQSGIDVKEEDFGFKKDYTPKKREEYLRDRIETKEITITELKELGMPDRLFISLRLRKVTTLNEIIEGIQFQEDLLSIKGITQSNIQELLEFLATLGITYPKYSDIEWNEDTPLRTIGLPISLYNIFMRNRICTLGNLKEQGISRDKIERYLHKVRATGDYAGVIDKLEELGYVIGTRNTEEKIPTEIEDDSDERED